MTNLLFTIHNRMQTSSFQFNMFVVAHAEESALNNVCFEDYCLLGCNAM
jgi:hypothetical protein